MELGGPIVGASLARSLAGWLNGVVAFPTQMMRNRDFDEAGYFTWVYGGDTRWTNFYTILLVLGFLFCVCFPIWPTFLRVFVWYMSVTFLLFIFGLITIRGFLFLCVWIVGWEFWFLPNLFDESLGFVESFKNLLVPWTLALAMLLQHVDLRFQQHDLRSAHLLPRDALSHMSFQRLAVRSSVGDKLQEM